MKSINHFKWPDFSWDSTSLLSVLDRKDRIIVKYKFYSRKTSIKQNLRHTDKFSFRLVILDRLITKELNNNKAAGGDIPRKLLKECDFTYEELTKCINN